MTSVTEKYLIKIIICFLLVFFQFIFYKMYWIILEKVKSFAIFLYVLVCGTYMTEAVQTTDSICCGW